MSKTTRKSFGDDFKPRDKNRKKKTYNHRRDCNKKLREVIKNNLKGEPSDELFE